MVIRFKCTCGAMGSADEAKVGELVHCTACGLDFPVPAGNDVPVAAEIAPAAGREIQRRSVPAAQRPASSRRAPNGKARAATHIGFKRTMWIPSLAVGLLCAVVGAYCFIPKSPARLPDLGVEDPQMVTDGEGHAWAIPQGAVLRPHKNGTMWYENTSGYEERAVSADDYVKRQKHAQGRQWGFLGFGISFFAVAGALVFLSLWMGRDAQWWPLPIIVGTIARRDVQMVGGGESRGKQPPE